MDLQRLYVQISHENNKLTYHHTIADVLKTFVSQLTVPLLQTSTCPFRKWASAIGIELFHRACWYTHDN